MLVTWHHRSGRIRPLRRSRFSALAVCAGWNSCTVMNGGWRILSEVCGRMNTSFFLPSAGCWLVFHRPSLNVPFWSDFVWNTAGESNTPAFSNSDSKLFNVNVFGVNQSRADTDSSSNTVEEDDHLDSLRIRPDNTFNSYEKYNPLRLWRQLWCDLHLDLIIIYI